MFANFLIRAQLTAKSVARKAAYGSLGGLFALIGIGFLAAAIWVALADAAGALVANLIIGAVFLLIGAVVLVYARIPPRVIPRHQARAMADPTRANIPPSAGVSPTVLTTASIAQAFILGLTTARRLRRRD